MKTTILKISLFTVMTTAFLSSCSSPAENLINANDKVTEANQDLEKANNEYIEEIDRYKFEMNEKIEANNKSIADFKQRINEQKKEAKEDYKKKIAELEQKNTDSKKKMDDYKADSKEGWENFKTEFNHDMDELGKAFKSLTVNNVK